ncbi:MAG: hypothetical protein F6K17_15440 [Okeania sp. SIO3C4]|nr:hypothetical protein [Okeania sp. SIO3B3]NER03909.1 hypothetical protein [Okeania sp. SIO3C4]
MVLPSRCYERFSRLLPGIAWLDVSRTRKKFGTLVSRSFQSGAEKRCGEGSRRGLRS